MKVGIYVPTWNSAKYIKKMIESVQSQTIQDWHMVILDDNSSDETFELAEICSKKDQRISVFKNKTHSGLIGKLKNQCIKMLPDSEYICHVGSEDIIPPYCFEYFIDYMDKNIDVGAACGSFMAFDNFGKEWMFPHVANTKEFNRDTLLKYMCLYPMRFYRTDVVKKVGGYSNELSSAVDYDLALRLDEITKIVRLYDKITYYYRQHGAQVSQRERQQQNLNAKKALEDALKRRNIDMIVKNNMPPFILEEKGANHFIWKP